VVRPEEMYARLAGVSIGIIIGVIAGVITAILIRSAFSAKYNAREIVAELLTVVALIFGTQWVGSTIFDKLPDDWILTYFPSVCGTFLLTLIYPLWHFIIDVGHNIGKSPPK
jgi:hypothetical protein